MDFKKIRGYDNYGLVIQGIGAKRSPAQAAMQLERSKYYIDSNYRKGTSTYVP